MEVINDYLTFAKPTPEKEEQMDVNEEIQHAVNVIVPLATMNGVQVKLSLAKTSCIVSRRGKGKSFNNA